MSYHQLYARWRDDPEAFWTEAAAAIDWDRPASRAFFDQGPAGEWFADGMVNACWNAIDRHVAAGHGDRIAIIDLGKIVREGTPTQLKHELRRRLGLDEDPTLDDVFLDATGRSRERAAGEVKEVRA